MVVAGETSQAAALAALGPSPKSRYRRAQALRVGWDVFQALCVAAVSTPHSETPFVLRAGGR